MALNFPLTEKKNKKQKKKKKMKRGKKKARRCSLAEEFEFHHGTRDTVVQWFAWTLHFPANTSRADFPEIITSYLGTDRPT